MTTGDKKLRVRCLSFDDRNARYEHHEVPDKKASSIFGLQLTRAADVCACPACGEVLLDLCERMGCPAYLLDPCGRIIFTSRHAPAEEFKHLITSQVRLAAANSAARAKLRNSAAAFETFVREPPAFGLMAIIPRPDSTPLLLYSLQIARQPGPDGQAATAVIVLTDPYKYREPDRMLLRDMFGLTKMEAAVAIGIANGKDLKQIAKERDVSPNTVKSQLKAVMAKTKTRRQAELVAMLARLVLFA